jgi:citrate synthase
MKTRTKGTLEERIEKVRSDLEDVKEKRKVAQYNWAEAEAAHLQTIHQLHNQWLICKGRVNIQLYTKVMEREFGSRHLIPQKVVTQQAHLCRSLHHMEVHEIALALVDEQNKELVKMMKKQILAIQEEESNVEMELMNQLCKVDAIVKTMQAALGIVPDPDDDWLVSLSRSTMSRRSSTSSQASPHQGMIQAFKGFWSFRTRSLSSSSSSGKDSKAVAHILEEEQTPGEPTTPLTTVEDDRDSLTTRVSNRRRESLAMITGTQ